MILEVYHGTDLSNAKRIVKTEFIYRYNKKHWLGNGIYFYLDLSLAEWWTTNPSEKFGVKVKDAAIVKTILEIQDNNLLDLRKLSDYTEFTELYFNEYIPLLNSGVFDIAITNRKQIRCSFCDYLKRQYDLQAIIGNFSLLTQPYLPDKYKEFSKNMNLYYIETQLCLFDNNCIIEKSIIV